MVDRGRGESGEGGAPLGRGRLLHRPRRHPDRAGPAPATRCGPTSEGLELAARTGAAAAARGGGHARGDERAVPRAERSRGREAAPAGERASSASMPAWRRTRIAGASRWLASGRPKGTSTAPSSCSTRRSGCTRATTSRTCGRSPRMKARLWVAQGRLAEALDWARERGVSVEDELELPAGVRAHHPRPGAPGPVRRGTAPTLVDARGARAPRAPPARRPKQGERTRSVIEILVLQALAHQPRGDIAAGARAAGTRPDPGRAGGLRPHLRR